MTTPDQPRSEPGPSADIDELRTDIEQTRQDLGETVGALSDKLDVKGRAQQKAADTKDEIVHRAADLGTSARSKPAVPVGIVLAVAAAIGVTIWLRRR